MRAEPFLQMRSMASMSAANAHAKPVEESAFGKQPVVSSLVLEVEFSERQAEGEEADSALGQRLLAAGVAADVGTCATGLGLSAGGDRGRGLATAGGRLGSGLQRRGCVVRGERRRGRHEQVARSACGGRRLHGLRLRDASAAGSATDVNVWTCAGQGAFEADVEACALKPQTSAIEKVAIGFEPGAKRAAVEHQFAAFEQRQSEQRGALYVVRTVQESLHNAE